MDSKDSFLKRIGKSLNLVKDARPIIQQKKKVDWSSGTYRYLFSVSYNGEKNLGEMGPIKNYFLDYQALRLRSWQAQIDSEIAQVIIKRHITWVIGKGLKLQSEPILSVLASKNIKLDNQAFSKDVEGHFNLYKKSRMADYSNIKSLDSIAKRVYKNAIVGGDVLVVCRYIDDCVKIQLIDGAHVQSPQLGTEYYPNKLDNGNVIINGVETSPEGEHIRYHIRQMDSSFKIIEAKGPTDGLQTAFLVYGTEHRLDNNRGVPLIIAVLETLKKLERYKEATVGSAEERQKIVYQIKQSQFSDNTNVLEGKLANAINVDGKDEDLAGDRNGVDLAKGVAASTNKQVFQMPIGQEMASLESKNELYFKDFYSVNIDIVCAAIGAPPEVMFSKYDSNFSASRAALKDWEHTLNVIRSDFAENFYQRVYNFWLETEILKMRIIAPGYTMAMMTEDRMILEAYRNARFIGPAVPHIDPVKEVAAMRLKMGTAAAHLPLITLEAATEELNGGESHENMDQFAKELTTAETLKILPAPVNQGTPPNPANQG